MLPNESLLVVLHFADYKTLVLTKFAGRLFLRLATKYAEELARRRSFRVSVYATYIEYYDDTIGADGRVRYVRGNQTSLATACRELAGVIGPHAVAELTSRESTWNTPSVGVIFDAAPPLKYAEAVVVRSYIRARSTTGPDSEAFMSNFAGMKSFHLWVDRSIFRQFRWTFLRQETFGELRRIAVSAVPRALTRNENHYVEELVRICATLPRLAGGEALELDFASNYTSAAFGLRIIELLTDSGCEVTFRLWTNEGDDELVLDESAYTVHVEGTTKRYTSEKSGIVVEVNGRYVAIQSTAQVPPAKRSRRTE